MDQVGKELDESSKWLDLISAQMSTGYYNKLEEMRRKKELEEAQRQTSAANRAEQEKLDNQSRQVEKFNREAPIVTQAINIAAQIFEDIRRNDPKIRQASESGVFTFYPDSNRVRLWGKVQLRWGEKVQLTPYESNAADRFQPVDSPEEQKAQTIARLDFQQIGFIIFDAEKMQGTAYGENRLGYDSGILSPQIYGGTQGFISSPTGYLSVVEEMLSHPTHYLVDIKPPLSPRGKSIEQGNLDAWSREEQQKREEYRFRNLNER